MKKIFLLLVLLLTTFLVVVSCGESEVTQSTALESTNQVLESSLAASSALPAETSQEILTTEPTVLTTAVETTVLPITHTAKNWMGSLSDDTPLNDIALPGTHDSGATHEYKFLGISISGTAKCQTLSIAEQLNIGVRFFDIRLRRVKGELQVYHGEVDQELTFDEVLSACYAFLAENPSEALVICIKEECDASGTNASFDSMVAEKIKEKADFWHTNPTIPKLGAVRGKIVLMRRYASGASFGINASSGWADNTTFTLSAGACVLSVQDYYNDESASAKWSAISAMFNRMKSQKNTYYLNFTSGYHSSAGIPNINAIKDEVNPKLIEYLKTSPDFVGIVIVDYITAEIAELIYNVNFD